MANQAEEPLLSNRDDEFDDTHSPEGVEAENSTSEHQTNDSLGSFVWLLTLSACISGLLFGYDTGVISATLVSIGTSLSGRELTSLDKSVVTSCTSLFALVASPLSSIFADRFGRKPVILLADVLFVFGALVQSFSNSVSYMVLGRSIVGAGVGAASFVTPLYVCVVMTIPWDCLALRPIAELAPAAHRGRLVTMNNLSVTFGQVVAYIIGWIFTEVSDPAMGWRWLVGLGVVPALLQCALLLFMPETPRWLVKVGRSREAWTIIQKTQGAGLAAGHEVDSILKDIEIEVRQERSAGGKNSDSWRTVWKELLAVPKNRRALIIACSLQALQQLCGFNSLMYFSATIFSILGFSVPTLTSLSVAATNFLFTVAALLLIDRIGRRRILLYSIPLMVLGLFMCAFGFTSVKLSPEPQQGAPPTPAAAAAAMPSQIAAVTILASIMLYVAAYAIGLGTVPWMQSELFPLNVRSLGSGLSTATNWLANFAIGLTFLPLMDSLTPTWTFVLYGLICVAGWFVVWGIYPETAGLTLEEATGLLEHGWGVR
ncbi:myo-inositol transporter 1 [Biscogniauxia mediterranea]|nr:myo-inositol transporter 1 [Biscogniauxia mediterranea]